MEFYVIPRVTMLSSVFFIGFILGGAVSLSDEYDFKIIEGDILLTPAEYAAIDKATDSESRNGMADVAMRWPDKTVVYHIEENVFDEEQIRKFHTAMRDIAHHTCIRFRERANENEHAAIVQGSEGLGCASQIGYKYNQPDQTLNLAKDCFDHGSIEHEILHTIGFEHMQNTYNRDDFVTINWDNIKPGGKRNFIKREKDALTDFGVPYDYGSVMHYRRTEFSKNGEDTVVPKEDVFIGQRIGLSPSDILKVNKMYDCP